MSADSLTVEVAQQLALNRTIQIAGLRAATPIWFKLTHETPDGPEFRMIWLNNAYEANILKPMGLSREDYIGRLDVEVHGHELGAAYYTGDLEAYDANGAIIKRYEPLGVGDRSEPLYVVKQSIEIDGRTIIRGECHLFSDFEKAKERYHAQSRRP